VYLVLDGVRRKVPYHADVHGDLFKETEKIICKPKDAFVKNPVEDDLCEGGLLSGD